MRAAVFTKGLEEKQKKEMLDYARCNYDFSGEYSEEEKLLEDANKRIVERKDGLAQVLERGKFDLVLFYDSLPEDAAKELDSLGIGLISFKKQKLIKEDIREDPEEQQVDIKTVGKFREVEPF